MGRMTTKKSLIKLGNEVNDLSLFWNRILLYMIIHLRRFFDTYECKDRDIFPARIPRMEAY